MLLIIRLFMDLRGLVFSIDSAKWKVLRIFIHKSLSCRIELSELVCKLDREISEKNLELKPLEMFTRNERKKPLSFNHREV